MEVFESALLRHHIERFKHFGMLMKDYTEFEQLSWRGDHAAQSRASFPKNVIDQPDGGTLQSLLEKNRDNIPKQKPMSSGQLTIKAKETPKKPKTSSGR